MRDGDETVLIAATALPTHSARTLLTNNFFKPVHKLGVPCKQKVLNQSRILYPLERKKRIWTSPEFLFPL